MTRLGDPPFICLITEGKLSTDDYTSERRELIDSIRRAADDGIDLVQIREKRVTGRLLLELSRDVVSALDGTQVRVVVNDRPDIAAAAGAAGVHLPATSLPPDVVRRYFPQLLIGVSTHSIDEARSAASAGADYVLFGPVFETPGKGGPVGVESLAEVCRLMTGTPVLALGGVDEKNFAATLTAGAAGIAAIRSLNQPESRGRICRAFGRHSVG